MTFVFNVFFPIPKLFVPSTLLLLTKPVFNNELSPMAKLPSALTFLDNASLPIAMRPFAMVSEFAYLAPMTIAPEPFRLRWRDL